MKKKFAGLMAAIMILGLLSACRGGSNITQENAQEKFDAFLEEFPAQMVEPNDMSLQYMFLDPGKAGIPEESYKLHSASSQKEWDESYEELENMIETLKSFGPSEDENGKQQQVLDNESEETRLIMLDALERAYSMKDYYALSSNNLGSYLGTQAELPILMADFRIESQKDLDNYFSTMESVKEAFASYAQQEKYRQEQGVGMSQPIIDKVIDQCDKVVADEHPFLIDSVNAKIDAIADFSVEDKAEAKSKNESLCVNDMREAYRELGDELRTIQAPQELLGLSHYKNGKEYYAALLKKNTCVDMTPEEAMEYLESMMKYYRGKLISEIAGVDDHTKLYDLSNAKIADFSSVEENIEFLYQHIGQDFPEIEQLNYKVYQVPDSMKDNFSPAATIRPPLDSDASYPVSVWINGAYDSTDYSTVSHETYSGHMYQFGYLRHTDIPLARKMATYGMTGYTEGYAKYIEQRTIEYVPGDKTLAKILLYNQTYQSMAVAACDIGIHYYGWNQDQVKEYLYNTVGEYSDEAISGIYAQLVETPTNMLYYYLPAAQMEDMYNDARGALGDSFNSVEFHRVLVENGAVSMGTLQEKVDEWIDMSKETTVQDAA